MPLNLNQPSGDITIETGVSSGDTFVNFNLPTSVVNAAGESTVGLIPQITGSGTYAWTDALTPSTIIDIAWSGDNDFYVSFTPFSYQFYPLRTDGATFQSHGESPVSPTTGTQYGYFGKVGDGCWMILQDAGPYLIPDGGDHILILWNRTADLAFRLPEYCVGYANPSGPTLFGGASAQSSETGAFFIADQNSQDSSTVLGVIVSATSPAVIAGVSAFFASVECEVCLGVVNSLVEFAHGGSAHLGAYNTQIMLNVDFEGGVTITTDLGGAFANSVNMRLSSNSWSYFEWIGNPTSVPKPKK